MHAEKTFQCNICSKMFSNAGLKSHMERHKKEPCPHCGKEYPAKDIKKHIERTHLPDHMKKYQCKICNPIKGFADKGMYKMHMNIHAGLTPYSKYLQTNTTSSVYQF